jgi:hypothetical protein
MAEKYPDPVKNWEATAHSLKLSLMKNGQSHGA